VKYDIGDKSGELSVVIANKYLLTVQGADVTQEDLASFFKAVDVKAIEKM
jgi:hypothetical protein